MQSFKLCKLLLWEGLYNIKTMKSYKARNSFHFASSTLVITLVKPKSSNVLTNKIFLCGFSSKGLKWYLLPKNLLVKNNFWAIRKSNRSTNTMAKTRQWQQMFCRCLRLIHFLFLIISIHQAGDTADLICSYYLDSHNLYSVKWYKVNCYL